MSQPGIPALIHGRSVTRQDVVVWEDRRISAAAKKLGITVPPGPPNERRVALADAKMAMGSDAIMHRFAGEIRASDLAARAAVLPTSRRRFPTAELRVGQGTAAGFVSWFEDRARSSDERAMVIACPDHFVLRRTPDGLQEVLQTTGAGPMVNRFYLDYTDRATLRTPRDESFPHEIAAVARLADGKVVGGARLEFRDLPSGGFEARLIEELPALSLPGMITQQSWHVACEFSNWFIAYLDTTVA